ncbi:MAG TPA: glycosyltransferase [Actinomycetota bacterium]|nr:glycosyltransferase [Actinomycetota bacterium]
MNCPISGEGSKPSVTAVIPTHNRLNFLKRSLRTVLVQQGVVLEVIVVDDGSDDDTAGYVDQIGDDRVRLVRHEVPAGVAAARNSGLRRARGDWVAFLDDDDLWAPDKLAAQLEAARRHGEARWVCTGSVTVDEGLQVLAVTPPAPKADLSNLLAYNHIPGGASGIMVRVELARSVGGFDTDLSNMADWDMWIRLSLESPLASVRRPLVARFEHEGGLSGNPRGILEEFERVTVKYGTIREERGVMPSGATLNWFARRQVEAGNGRAAARNYFHVAHTFGDHKSWGRAVVAYVHAELLRKRWSQHARRTLDSPWMDEAEAWLAPLREWTVEHESGSWGSTGKDADIATEAPGDRHREVPRGAEGDPAPSSGGQSSPPGTHGASGS